MLIIHNGYDLSRFHKDIKLRDSFRAEVNIASDEILLGMVGRFHPQKAHEDLFKSFLIAKRHNSGLRLVLVGTGMTADNAELISMLKKYDLVENVTLLGQRVDIPAVMNGFDIHLLSSSFGEGFPNVLAEAMACGTPCISTDVGDASYIVGKTGWLVAAKDTDEFGGAILDAIDEQQNHKALWHDRSLACQGRIKDEFGIEKMTNKYGALWSGL